MKVQYFVYVIAYNLTQGGVLMLVKRKIAFLYSQLLSTLHPDIIHLSNEMEGNFYSEDKS